MIISPSALFDLMRESFKDKKKRLKDTYLKRSRTTVPLDGEIGFIQGLTITISKEVPMVEIQSIEGPEVHGPNRYRVKNPAKNRYIEKPDGTMNYFGFTYQHIMLNGEMVFVDHVSHKRLPTYPEELVIVVKPNAVKRLQCKDIPDLPILEFLSKQRHPQREGEYMWATVGKPNPHMPVVNDAMPMVNDANWKLAPAKMSQLIRRGLVNGDCGIGYRGDYVITQKGLAYLEAETIKQGLKNTFE